MLFPCSILFQTFLHCDSSLHTVLLLCCLHSLLSVFLPNLSGYLSNIVPFFKVFCIMWSCLSKSCFLHHAVWKYGGIKLIIHPYWFGSNYGAHKALFSSKLIITFLMNKSSHPSKFKMLGVTLDLHFVWIKGIWRVWKEE